jgi:predicted XRE-type DNA-binding protein
MYSDKATIQILRSDLALQISRVARRMGETQAAAAARLGVPQPTLSKIINGRVYDLSIEFLLRVAVRANLPIAMQTGRNSKEAGVFVSNLTRCSPPLKSKLAQAARKSMSEADHRLTPSERLEAFLEHNQLIGALHQAARTSEKRRGCAAPSGS